MTGVSVLLSVLPTYLKGVKVRPDTRLLSSLRRTDIVAKSAIILGNTGKLSAIFIKKAYFYPRQLIEILKQSHKLFFVYLKHDPLLDSIRKNKYEFTMYLY